jgi:hypothetical protein
MVIEIPLTYPSRRDVTVRPIIVDIVPACTWVPPPAPCMFGQGSRIRAFTDRVV